MKRLASARLAGVAAALLLLAGAAATVAGCGGDDSGEPSTAERTQDTKPAETTPSAQPQATTTAPAGPVLRKRRRDRAERGIQRTVTRLVDSAERGDARGFCAAVGRSPSGSGLAALESCARTASVPLEALPTSDELSIERVELAGDRATVTLVAGQRVLLRRRGDGWTVASVTPGA